MTVDVPPTEVPLAINGATDVAINVAITGATGFIGGRLVEILASGAGPLRPHVLSRRRGPDPADTIAAVDLQNPHSVRAALAGCRAAVHCAFDFADMESNREIARVLADACAAGGIRLIQVSTAAVYEPLPDGPLDETHIVDHATSPYQQVKLGIEADILQRVRTAGLDAVILQPAVVYGPQGRAWTDSPIRELLTGTVVLPAAGAGSCNAVYVDDVCRAIIAAVTAPAASGERFLISAAAPVTWREFYQAYQAMLGRDALELSTAVSPLQPATLNAPLPGRAQLKRLASKLIGARARSRAMFAVNYLRGLIRPRRHVATGPKLALFQSHCHMRIEKAQRLLDYAPEFDLARGMQATQPYVQATYGKLIRR